MNKSSLRTALEMITEGAQAQVAEVLKPEALAKSAEASPWMKSKTVQGYGIGRRFSGGHRMNELALKVYVEKKKPKSDLGREMVPSKIKLSDLGHHIETDVEEIGKIEKELDTGLHRPAFPGCGLGHVDVTVGTFGALVRKVGDKSKLYILSNSHVLADEGVASLGDKIIQPGAHDGGSAPADVIATLDEFIPFDFGSAFTNLVDAAIAKVKKKSQVISRVSTIGVPPSGVGVARVGTKVKKVGRTTGLTHGEVLDTDFKTQLRYKKPGGGTGIARFRDQVLCTRYTAGGDSGSIILHEENNKALGLHFAGSASSSIFNKIQNVIVALDIEIVTDDI